MTQKDDLYEIVQEGLLCVNVWRKSQLFITVHGVCAPKVEVRA